MMYTRNDNEIEERINKEIDSCGLAYKLTDREGNIFIFAGIEGGFPNYRTRGGRVVITDLVGYDIVEKYCKL